MKIFLVLFSSCWVNLFLDRNVCTDGNHNKLFMARIIRTISNPGQTTAILFSPKKKQLTEHKVDTR